MKNWCEEPDLDTLLTGIGDKILAHYAKGMTTRDIARLMQELYGVEMSHTVISQITDAVFDDVRAWQSSPGRAGD